MPYRIRREGDKYCLHNSDTGKRVPGSCHSSRSDTLRMLQAIESNLSEKSIAYSVLTPTEMVISRYIVAGLADKQIAIRLGISPMTASTHVKSIIGKLGVSCRGAIPLKMLFCGLIVMEDLSSLYEIGCSEKSIR